MEKEYDRTPRRLFLVNFWLDSSEFAKSHWKSLVFTAILVTSPVCLRRIQRSGILQIKRIMTNADLLQKCKERDIGHRGFLGNELVYLRVKVLSVSSESIRAVHCPQWGSLAHEKPSKLPNSAELITSDDIEE